MEVCDTFKKIPREEIDRVFTESDTAAADMDFTFLCFEEVYQKVKEHCNENTIILDFGCAYGPQAVYFTDCDKYIGIDLPMPMGEKEVRFEFSNTEYFIMSGQKFIKEVLPTLNLDKENIVAVCSYCPDTELQQMVANTFPYNYVQYCDDIISDKLPDIDKEQER